MTKKELETQKINEIVEKLKTNQPEWVEMFLTGDYEGEKMLRWQIIQYWSGSLYRQRNKILRVLKNK